MLCFLCMFSTPPPPAPGFLIPGTSSNVSVFLSIVRTEGQNFVIAAQAQLALRDVDPFEEGQIHTLVMSENIQVRDSPKGEAV